MKVNIIISLLLSIIYCIQFIDCQNICNSFLNVNFPTKLNPCGVNIDQPCQTIQESVTGCGDEYDVINLNFKNGTYQIGTIGPFNQITNKTINFINSDITTTGLPIIIDLSITTTPVIDILAITKYDFTSININGFTFQSISNSNASIINNKNSILNSTIENCNFINSVIGGNGLISLYGQTSSNANSSILSVTNSFINIVNCQFENINSLTPPNRNNGGLIYSESSSQFTMVNCNFSNILIDNLVEGGLFDLQFGSLSISDSRVYNCSFKNGFFINSPFPTLNPLIQFSNISFISNSNGIGIMVASLLYTLMIKDSIFVNNNNFVSVSIIGSPQLLTSTISNCFFALNNNTNQGNDTTALTYYQGTSISVFSSDATITGCTFNGNRANYGSAVYASDSLVNPQSKISISNCTFIDNHSLKQGGSIYVDSIYSLNITNSEFDDNVAFTENGGSLLFCKENSNIIIRNITSINEYDSNTITCTNDNSNCNFENSDTNYLQLCQNNENNKSNKLSPGQIAGIVFGCIGAMTLILIIIFYIGYYRKFKKNNQYKPIGL